MARTTGRRLFQVPELAARDLDNVRIELVETERVSRQTVGRRGSDPEADDTDEHAGSILEDHDGEGDVDPFYASLVLIGWDSEREMLRRASANNMGDSHIADIHQTDSGRFFQVGTEVANGVPSSEVVEISTKDGKLSQFTISAMVKGEVFHSAAAKYTPAR